MNQFTVIALAISGGLLGHVIGQPLVFAQSFQADRNHESSGDRPNIILILADDLGWADAGCYGNRFNETPRIDQMAREGMRFTQFYAGPVCSPTRANIQSGLDQARFGITQHIPGHRRPFARLIDPAVPLQLPLEVVTFAETLQQLGYATGYFGKWHLGGNGFGPQEQGWQTLFEGQGNEVPPKLSGLPEPVRAAEFLTDKAVEFIQANKQQSFLLQLSHYAVHIPLSTTPELLTKYEAKTPAPEYPSRPKYAGLLEELDQSVGRVLDAVDESGIAENTLIIFVSDNGGLETEQNGTIVTSNEPLRNEKGTLYEGGIRVPAIARWTGQIPANVSCDVPATTIDLYPTFIESASSETSPFQRDGVSLFGLLTGTESGLPRDTLFWHLPHYHHSTPASVIRQGDWKLIEFLEDSSIELYNLRDDLSEQHNLAANQPDLVRELRAALEAWRQRVGAKMPTPNPDYDPQRANELAKKGRKNR
ncbi:sulfatase [Neorhodopirellula pilleata]|uniref:sulfatase n=1 Tax=Neorhodopirellula pilleata TaxID=2714738 RepID=UPI0018CF3FEC|nr:sulfatase [Neorhodopirellula pilleata]